MNYAMIDNSKDRKQSKEVYKQMMMINHSIKSNLYSAMSQANQRRVMITTTIIFRA